MTEAASFGSSVTGMTQTVSTMQQNVLQSMSALNANPSNMSPAAMLTLQFQMTQLSQVTEATSNLIAGMNSMLSAILRNLKGS